MKDGDNMNCANNCVEEKDVKNEEEIKKSGDNWIFKQHPDYKITFLISNFSFEVPINVVGIFKIFIFYFYSYFLGFRTSKSSY